MEKKIGLLEDAIDVQADLKEKDTEVGVLGIVVGQDLGLMNSILGSTMNRITENNLELLKGISIEDEY